ncbi:MAG TPA: UDP-N-acetylglucosamine 2-epimerase (non-hydrolyzing) [Firmicutes bacterium]|nr:UDP-N-acetylglucosamine 2-epimerase (non-hydrolyzing) [Bacillota bacterium]
MNNSIQYPKVLAVFGTRPEAIKMAPVVNALNAAGDFQIKTVVTAQHREMLDQVLTIFGIRPDYDLNIMSPGQNLTEITCRVLQGLDPVFKTEKPDLILVHGDTTTAFASSLAAFYLHIPVGHVEAGLRTGDKQQPFPEELNRLLTGRIADLHFAPTANARENLLRENIPAESIQITGNTVIDALYFCLRELSLDVKEAERQLILVTVHRRENWGPPLENVVKALKNIIKDNPMVNLIIPVHLNPVVRQVFFNAFQGESRVKLVEPLDYQSMIKTMAEAYLVITDSGGIQEEAPSLGKPVLVLREKTERPEAVAAGTVKLVGTDTERITSIVNLLLNEPGEYLKMSKAVNPYGDGKATERIMNGLRFYFGLIGNKPADFIPS